MSGFENKAPMLHGIQSTAVERHCPVGLHCFKLCDHHCFYQFVQSGLDSTMWIGASTEMMHIWAVLSVWKQTGLILWLICCSQWLASGKLAPVRGVHTKKDQIPLNSTTSNQHTTYIPITQFSTLVTTCHRLSLHCLIIITVNSSLFKYNKGEGE
jgi:hypothetical protein